MLMYRKIDKDGNAGKNTVADSVNHLICKKVSFFFFFLLILINVVSQKN